jgi:hypothetical protein
MPLEFNLNGMSMQSVNDTYVGEYYNTGNATVNVYLTDNYTSPAVVYYSSLAKPVSGILDTLVLIVAGIALLIGGAVTAVVGLLMRRKPSLS